MTRLEVIKRKLRAAMRKRDKAYEKLRKLREYRAYRDAEDEVSDLCDQGRMFRPSN